MKTKKKNLNIFYVYHLINPITNLPFYVGKGNGNRMYEHEKSVRSGNRIRSNRMVVGTIKKILNENKSVIYKKVYENKIESDALKLEIEEIKKYGRRNNNTGILCNMTNGGDGFSGRVKSKTEIERIRKRMLENNPFKGKTHSEESRRKIADREYIRGNDHHFSKPTKTSFKSGKDHPFAKPIIYRGKRYHSISQAAKINNTSNHLIRKEAFYL